jgi:hypothetical protein
MIYCMICKSICTIANIVTNHKEEKRCVTVFKCYNCGGQTRVIQAVISESTKPHKRGDEIYV